MEKLKNRLNNYNSFTTEFQKQTHKTFTSLLKNLITYNYTCIDTEKLSLNNFIHINKDLVLTASVNADILFGDTEIINKNKKVVKMPLAIKKVVGSSEEIQYLANLKDINNIKPQDIYDLNSDVLTELYFLNITTKLLENKITNNLPFIYKYYICNECVLSNKKLIEKHNSNKVPCMYLITEKANGDLESYIVKKEVNKKKLYSAYLQIYIALYIIKKYYGIEHNDLHIGNVLYFNVQPGGYWKYKIKNKVIYVPNYGQLFILWDFGYAFSKLPELIGAPSNINLYKKNKPHKFEDYIRILGGLTHKNHRFDNELNNLIEILNSAKNTHEIVYQLYEKLQKLDKIPDNPKIIDTFNTNKKI